LCHLSLANDVQRVAGCPANWWVKKKWHFLYQKVPQKCGFLLGIVKRVAEFAD